MQLFKSEQLEEGRIYSACLCNKTVGRYTAIKPPGKSYITLLPIGGKYDIPPDFFDWWVLDPARAQEFAVRWEQEWAEVEVELRKRRKTRL